MGIAGEIAVLEAFISKLLRLELTQQ